MKNKHFFYIILFIGSVFKMRESFGNKVSLESCFAISLLVLFSSAVAIFYTIVAMKFFIKHFVHLK